MDILLHADTQHSCFKAIHPRRRSEIPGKFYTPFCATNIVRITQTWSYLANKANICNKGAFDSDCKRAIVLPCTVTQNLDLDQMSERSIRILKDTTITLTFFCKFWFSASYDPLWMILLIFVT